VCRNGVVSPAVPVWSSRETWIGAVREFAASPAFQTVLAALRKSGQISAVRLVAVAVALAERADHGTGRNAAVTNAVLAARAGCSERSVTTARTVLAAAGFGVEAARGHGSATGHSAGNRPSIWHLIGRRQTAPEPPSIDPRGGGDEAIDDPCCDALNRSAAGATCDLPPKAGLGISSPVGNHSPSAPTSAPEGESNRGHERPRRCYRTTPRPMAVQRLAGQLVASAHGLHRGHIGAVCDAITGAGIDPNAWTARQLSDALNADMRATGWSWPNYIERPGAFLAGRLRRLPARPDRTSHVRSGIASGLDEERRGPVSARLPVDAGDVPVRPADRATIAAVMVQVGQQLAEERQRRAHAPHTARALSHRQPAVRTVSGQPDPDSAACCSCSAPNARRRAYLPARRAYLCDGCWTARPAAEAQQPATR
jgi:hypothetical protein